ncbi:MAG TPA: DNA methyltransferase [Chitinophagaceae bacterium]|jgi:site-specific DNA-cytosine methylase|nr:DNA methyltransferase [Chitinophagaceae bacterium]
MKVLELFAGSRSIGKASEILGYQVFSSDLINFEKIDYVTSILDFDINKVPFQPDIIWASPPCTAFSVAAIGKNWTKDGDNYIAKNPRADFGLELVKKTIQIIQALKPTYFFIENPRGMLRKMPIMADLNRQGVTYCQYGDTRMKPTDIWTNSLNWIPRPMCKNGDDCHIAAPRGSSTGTQGLKGAYERSKIPEDLCLEILKSCI